MTNADCIRRMSDDQLYDFLSEWECGDIDYSITFCDLCKQGGNELNLDCDGCRKHWLQRDAVDVGGLMYWKRNTTFTADTPQTDKDKVVCPNCGRSDYIRSFEKDFNIKNSEYRYKCINCNTYINDTPQTESTGSPIGDYRDGVGAWQTDCGWK